MSLSNRVFWPGKEKLVQRNLLSLIWKKYFLRSILGRQRKTASVEFIFIDLEKIFS